MGYLNTLTKIADFLDGVWSTLMKISFRGGIYITLMITIIFMRVCFPLSRKTVPLTKSPVCGSGGPSQQVHQHILCPILFA
jgi:hypothetical protein